MDESKAVALEPYVEREDFNGLSWRQMQKNGALVPDEFFKRCARCTPAALLMHSALLSTAEAPQLQHIQLAGR